MSDCHRGCLHPDDGGSYLDWMTHKNEGEPRCKNSKASWALYMRNYRARRKALGGPTTNRQELRRQKAEELRERMRAARAQAEQLKRNEEKLKRNG